MIVDFPFGTILLLQLPGYLEVATEYIIGGNTKVMISTVGKLYFKPLTVKLYIFTLNSKMKCCTKYILCYSWHGIRAYTRNHLSFIGQHLIGTAASIALLIYST